MFVRRAYLICDGECSTPTQSGKNEVFLGEFNSKRLVPAKKIRHKARVEHGWYAQTRRGRDALDLCPECKGDRGEWETEPESEQEPEWDQEAGAGLGTGLGGAHD